MIVFMNEQGFSLLELLLVMLTITVMVTLLAASTVKAKREAQRVSCRVAIRSYVVGMVESSGRFLIEIPQEANCHDCHKPRYNAGLYLDQLTP
jgi:competence protein ComGC